MKQRNVWVAILILLVAMASGCASMGPVSLQSNFWQDKQARIGVVVLDQPVPKAYRSGGQGVLDQGINEVANHTLDTYLSTLRVADYERFCNEFIEGIVNKGINVQRIGIPLIANELEEFTDGSLDGSCDTKDYRAYIQKAGVDKLIIISMPIIGTTRPYYGFIPLGPPKGFCMLGGKMIEAKTNKILWQNYITSIVPPSSNWDTPPNFPEITEKVLEAYNMSQQRVRNSFFGPPLDKVTR